ncbi:MAG: LuxR C-terminal-related transcriptional regulator, partial [Beijerinckiaceae bacterium]|nr:LuxR C-terminal-related transcriptional regulator [Beijerinckiaceae bacterium]
RQDCVSMADINSSRQLQSLIVSASRQINGAAQGGSLIVRNEDGRPEAVVHVLPLGRRAAVFPANDKVPAAGLLIAGYRREDSERIRVFSELFGLTAAEARVLSHMMTGGGVTKAAERLKIAPSTAQTHLKRILEKTGTHRQAELVQAIYETTIPRYGSSSAKDDQALRWPSAWASGWVARASGKASLMPANDCESSADLSSIAMLPSNERSVTPRRVQVR